MKALTSLALLLLLVAAPLAGCDSSDAGVADANSTVTVAYEGRFENGTVFDSSPNSTFNLGGTIEGFRNNVAGMRVGESKTFTVPPELGYGPVARPGIPANSTLIFDVTLLAIG